VRLALQGRRVMRVSRARGPVRTRYLACFATVLLLPFAVLPLNVSIGRDSLGMWPSLGIAAAEGVALVMTAVAVTHLFPPKAQVGPVAQRPADGL